MLIGSEKIVGLESIESDATTSSAAVNPATVDSASFDPASVDPASVDSASVFGLADGILVALFVIAVTLVWRRWKQTGSFASALKTLAPSRPRIAPMWTPLEALMSLFLAMLFTGVVVQFWVATRVVDGRAVEQAMVASGNISEFALPLHPVMSVAMQGIVLLMTVALVNAALVLRQPKTLLAIGWFPKGSDLKLGLLWSLLLLPLVLIMMTLLSLWVPYEHNDLESFTKLRDPVGITLAFISIGLITPVGEEFLYRGLIQGGFECLGSLRQRYLRHLADGGVKHVAMRGLVRVVDFPWRPQGYWPIVFSSAIFAAMHWGQGAAPIALFVLALGLGYLYRQTGSLWPGIVVHAVLNSSSLTFTLYNAG